MAMKLGRGGATYAHKESAHLHFEHRESQCGDDRGWYPPAPTPEASERNRHPSDEDTLVGYGRAELVEMTKPVRPKLSW